MDLKQRGTCTFGLCGQEAMTWVETPAGPMAVCGLHETPAASWPMAGRT